MKTPLSTLSAPLRVMKKLYVAEFFAVFIIVGLLAGYFSLNAASSTRNKPLIFQGRITDNSYVPLADSSTVYLKFAFYDASSGGNCLWTTGTNATGLTNCPITNSIARGIATTVTRGIFTVNLGDSTVTNMPVLPLDFNASGIYIGVTACTSADSGCDAEMTPRVRVGGSAYAYNADELDGIDSARFLKFHTTATGETVTSGTATSTVWQAGAYSAQAVTSEKIDLDFDFATNGLQYTTGADLATQRTMLIRSRTYSATAATQTLTHASTLGILGAPTVGANTAITNASSLRVLTAAVGAATNSYGLYVDAMTGATNNYAAAFASGNVGIGSDVTPDYVLELNKTTAIANAFSMSADDVAHGLTALHNGTFRQQLETGTFFQIGALNGGGLGTGGALLTGVSDSDSPGLRILGVMGSNDPTDSTPAIYLSGSKSNGTTGRTSLGNAETVLYVSNDESGILFLNGSGDLGLGDASPNGTLDLLSATAASTTAIILTHTNGNDPVINFEIAEGTGAYSFGLDNDDGDQLKISASGTLGTTDMYAIDSRATLANVTAHRFVTPAITLASAAGNVYTTFFIDPSTLTYTGTIPVTTQVETVNIDQQSITDASALTIDDAALLAIDGAPAGAGSVTISDSYALKINTATAAGTTRTYGLYVDAMTGGAGTHYAAAFATGNVGILTTTPNESLDVSGSIGVLRTGTAATTYTATATDYYIGMTSTSARTLNLPTAASITGRVYIIKDEGGNAGTNNITIDPSGAETIDGSATNAINANYGFRQIISDGTNWMIMGRE